MGEECLCSLKNTFILLSLHVWGNEINPVKFVSAVNTAPVFIIKQVPGRMSLQSRLILQRSVWPQLSWRGKCFYTGSVGCPSHQDRLSVNWPTLHHDPLQMFSCKSRALTKIWLLPIRHCSCLMNWWSDVASLIRASARGDWLELREKMSIPMKEFIINLSFSYRELVSFHVVVLLFQFCSYFPVYLW